MNARLTSAPVAALPLDRFAPMACDTARRRLLERLARGRDLLGGHVRWHVREMRP
jgi:hypothetical protein